MYKIAYYQDKKGKSPIADYLKQLSKKNDKNSRILLKKIVNYIDVLCEYGTRAGEPYMKHIDGDIWELRPVSDRIFFAAWDNGSFLLLHSFTKKTQKTPPKEIERAKRELADFRERIKNNE